MLQDYHRSRLGAGGSAEYRELDTSTRALHVLSTACGDCRAVMGRQYNTGWRYQCLHDGRHRPYLCSAYR